ncbi:MAG: hypothetical protein LKE51_04190 [Selenomonas sp.]|nr:hypothetical protein [Selenomonas sp.]
MPRHQGMDYRFQTVNLEDAHPNTAVIYLVGVTWPRRPVCAVHRLAVAIS